MSQSSVQALKRGWPAQRERRQKERDVRCRAVAFDRWATRLGMQRREVARDLGVSTSTLGYWHRRWHDNRLAAKALGRHCKRSSPQARNEAINLMWIAGPGIGMPALRSCFPKMPYGELHNLQIRYRRLWCQVNRRLVNVLHWHRPGAVWAMDHVEAPSPIDSRWLYLLAVRDLATGYQLAWLPVGDQSAESTINALKQLFVQHGPPLVLKSDNGSGFIAETTRQFLEDWRVRPLYSPPYTPSYNGSVEAGNGALKLFTHEQAAHQDRAGCWTADDAEAARCMANELMRPRRLAGQSRAEAWRAREPISAEERGVFGRTLEQHENLVRSEEGYPIDIRLGLSAQATVDRLAIRRALVDRGILTFTRRLITPPIRTHFAIRIT